MRVAIETLGTRGDVQPYLALARVLQERGHVVQLAAPAQFASLAAQNRVPFAPLPGEFLALLDTPEGKAAVSGGQGFSAGFKLLKHVRPLMRRLLETEWQAVKDFGPDMIVYHPKSVASPHMAQALGVPHILASPLPGFTPTAAFPSPMLPYASLGPLNWTSHLLAMHGADLLFGKMLREWRREALGLPSRFKFRMPNRTIYAYSKHVVPVPSDWTKDILVSGYWFLDEPSWTMPDGLASFLACGDRPVYVGFGSMPGLDPEALADTAMAALAQTGKRGLLAIGGGALKIRKMPAHVHVIDTAPHGELFRHVSATVHHGGAGTTAASIRAGVPMTICPFFGDQPFWARRIVDLGIGPGPLDRKRLDVRQFAAALTAMEDPGMIARAIALGTKVQAEDGLQAVVSLLEAASL
jgi:sterol 3beta-glucosyltransferase